MTASCCCQKKDALVKMSIYAVFSSFSKQDFRLLYHKCALLQSQDRVDEFVEAGIELFKLFFNDVYHNKDLMGRRSPLWFSVLLCFSFYSSSLLPSSPPSLPSSFLPPSFPSLPSFHPPSLPSFLLSWKLPQIWQFFKDGEEKESRLLRLD